jgi:hypothetical protein
VSLRRAVALLAPIAVAYIAVPIGLLILSGFEGAMWQIANQLYSGEFLLGWSLLALVAVAVSVTCLAYAWKRMRWWFRVVVIVLNVPVVAATPLALNYSIQGFQDYAAAHAAYDAAVQACGRPPIIATDKDSWGGGYYIRPGDPDYGRQAYSSHIHLLLNSGTIFFCTEADAVALGYRPYS